MTAVNQFIYNKKHSYDDMSLIITETPPFVIAERDIEFTRVPGRNGDIITDNGGYLNVTKEYTVAALSDRFSLPQLARKIGAWLNGAGGYYELSDTYDPQYFRYARYSGSLNIANILQQIGTATLHFNCKPFKYRLTGKRVISLNTSGVLHNPEEFESRPYIRIYGDGDVTLYINSDAFSIAGINEYIEIDSELMTAYKVFELQNNKIYFADFPKLNAGVNNISAVGNVSKIEIVPRWCTL